MPRAPAFLPVGSSKALAVTLAAVDLEAVSMAHIGVVAGTSSFPLTLNFTPTSIPF